ncbi:hypothetical protein [Streptomyces sp. NPDC048720]|uniref:hypothetical protein n=1 Tax=Streptomyces sp. NPDC048720 TaxID=3365588 RepID=UPI00371C2A13
MGTTQTVTVVPGGARFVARVVRRAEMESHDAEFREGVNLLPVNDFCALCGQVIEETDSWGRDESQQRVHYDCMAHLAGTKSFRTQAAKDATIARIERALDISSHMAAKYEKLYHDELEESKKIGATLERMRNAPIKEG